MKKVLFIYNPHAGKGVLKTKLSDVLDIIAKAGYEITVYPTQCYKDAYYKVASFEEDYERVICSGGDGTLDEVVTGMMERKHKVPIGYIPTGTTNDFANSLHIPKDLLQATDVAVNGEKFACDIGDFNKDIFVYVAAFGLFTDVSYLTNQEMKNMLGHLAYLLEGATRLFDIPSHHMIIKHDGITIEDDFCYGMVTNSKSVGGFRHMVDKNVKFDDGKFEVTLIKAPKNPLALQEIVKSLVTNQVNENYMYAFKTNKITFDSVEEVAWTLDGEFGGQHDHVKIKNHKRALEIMVSEKSLQELKRKRNYKEEKEDKLEEKSRIEMTSEILGKINVKKM